MWEHLQVSAKSRKQQMVRHCADGSRVDNRGGSHFVRQQLEAGVRYVDYCADVMGPEKIHHDVCPLPTEPTTSAIVAANREGLSERTVSNYRSKFIAVSDAAGQQFPRIDTEQIQQKLSLPICGAPAPNACKNDPHGFLRRSGASCAELIAQSDCSISEVRAACPLSCQVPTTECQVDTSRYITGEGFVRTNDCHYMDMGIHPDGPAEFLMRGGDIDAMCYACLCTLETVANERASIETWFAGDADEGHADPVSALQINIRHSGRVL